MTASNPDPIARQAFAWKPGPDTAIAFGTALVFPAVYYANSRWGQETPWVFFLVFVGLGHLLLNTALPAWVVLVQRGEGLAGLGITRRRVGISLALSLLLAGSMAFSLWEAAQAAGTDLIPHLAFNALVLWEVLFVFGWLQLRFERAFGYVAAPVLAALAFAGYHLGSFDPSDLPVLLGSGVFFGIAFGITRNLAVLYPLAWAVSSSLGTLMGGFVADWSTVAIYAIIVVLQVLILYGFARVRSRREDAGTASTATD